MKAKTIMTLFLFSVLTAAASFSAHAANVISIENECVTVEDIFPNIGIKDQVFCGLDYGETRKLSVQLATHIINKYNIKAAPGEAYFNRKGRKIEQTEIEAKIYERLSQIYPHAELQIDKIRIQSDIYTAEDGKFSIDISNPRIGGMYGRLNNGFKDTGFTVYVKGYMEVFVTTDRIRKGDTVENYIKTEKVELSRLRGEPITNPEGLIATRGIGAGVPLTGEFVSEQPDLPEGAAVKLVYKGSGMQLETRGILQENAFSGNVVKVKNADSGKIVTAKYQGGRTALVNF
ncbi:flagellar basal body P-ring formation protein FlgA [Geovibrio thiophilus]|uniref:Flagellar basal body P-ring formation protein FlgA n=1 Tax=Geovibrio thiophilus TaxID=139438 RepID=A0A410JVN5_9BACT|nr:flagellar basal body P-ring formation chaperone FlgA [Geovibrio thiophilus]QAR32252.1 flagellar basal body P-ring formation protein FlgA [Geovibrio thiophilus]